MRSLQIGATGMLAQQTNVDVISNNIANMNTTAYTKRRAEFTDLLYQNIIRPGAASTAEQIGSPLYQALILSAKFFEVKMNA